MPPLEFDRDAVGVSAKSDWQDAEEFAGIARFLGGIELSAAAHDLPAGSNAGVADLRRAGTNFAATMRLVVAEYSDACAVLGSGQAEAISNFDETEFAISESYIRLRDRLEGAHR